MILGMLSQLGVHAAPVEAGGKSLDDINSLLAYFKPDPEKAMLARKAASRPLPETTDPKELARFLMTRAEAAEEVGLFRQQLEDIRQAYALDTGTDIRQEVLRRLAVAEQNGGNPLNAIKLREEFIVKETNAAPKVGMAAALARIYVGLGDLEGATRTMRGAQQYRVRAAAGETLNKAHWGFQFAWSNARILQDSGKYAEAEQKIRDGLNFLKEDEADNNKRQASGKYFFTPATRALVEESLLNLLAKLLTDQNRFIEAELVLTDVVKKTITRTGRYSPAGGNALLNLAELFAQQGRREKAATLVELAMESFEQAGIPPESAYYVRALRSYAHRLAEKGDYEKAIKQYERLEQALSGDDRLREQLARGDVVMGLALIKVGRVDEAAKILDKVLAEFRQTLGDKDRKTIEAAGTLAQALARQGDNARAAREFEFASKALLEAEDTDEGGAVSQQRKRAAILQAYIAFLADAVGREPARAAEYGAEAFRIADAVRGQSVQRALAASAARTAAGNPALEDLVRREQDIANQIGARFALIRTALALPPDQQNPQLVAGMRKEIDQLRSERNGLRKELAEKFPEYANLVNPKPVSPEELQRVLQPNEALASFLTAEDGSFVWIVRKDKPLRFAGFDIKAKQLDKSVRKLRRALDAEVGLLEELPDFDLDEAHKLYVATLKPVEDAWRDADTLFVVPDGALAQLPFALLPTQPSVLGKDSDKLLFSRYRNVPWLIQKVALAQLPTANALLTLRAMPAGKATRLAFAGFGDPYFSHEQYKEAEGGATPQNSSEMLVKRDAVGAEQLAQLPRLPDTREEVLAMAQALGADTKRDVFLGTIANEKSVKSADLHNRRIVAFATHGLVPGELDGLAQPALALSSPAVTGGEGDGLLTVDEILGLKLDADWVVLSACNTASSNAAGEEPLSGLVRAFFFVGARSVLASNWPVETSAARYITTNMFARQTRQPALTRSQTMRQSLQEMIKDGRYVDPATKQAVFAYAHPIFWAPFSLVGDGGR